MMYSFKDTNEFGDGSIKLPGMNLGVRSSVFKKIRFNNSLPGALCDDVDFLYRASHEGYKIRFEPSIRILHLNPATISDFIRQEIRHGSGHSIFQSLHPETMKPREIRTIPALMKSVILFAPGHLMHFWRLGSRRDRLFVLATLLYWWRVCIGNLAYLRATKK
jgi:GT2 family glycosyltransferase